MLAERLRHYADDKTCVLGIARGGLVVAAEVARRLSLPLDVLVARKRRMADDFVCPYPLPELQSIATWYQEFEPVSDDTVAELLEESRDPHDTRRR